MLAATLSLLLAAAPEPFTLQAAGRADVPMIEIAARQEIVAVEVHLQRNKTALPSDHQVTFPRMLKGEVQRLALEEAYFVRVVARVGEQVVERTLQARVEPPPPPPPPRRRLVAAIDRLRVSSGSGLDAEAVRRVLSHQLGGFTACVESKQGTAGRADLRLEVSPQGRVTGAHVRSVIYRSEAIENCLLERARRLVFPASSRASKLICSLLFRD